jgi:hypothetical protein
MERLTALPRGAQIMLGAGALLFLSLFLPWQDFDVGGIAESLGVDASWNAWHGFLGWMLGLLTIVLLAWLIVRIAAVDLPLPVSPAMVAGILGALILFFAVVKNLADEESTVWSYIGVLLAIAVAVGAWLQIQDAGGLDTLKTEASTMRTQSPPSTSAAPPPPADEPPAPPPPSAPPPSAPPSSQPPDAPPRTTPPPSEAP